MKHYVREDMIGWVSIREKDGGHILTVHDEDGDYDIAEPFDTLVNAVFRANTITKNVGRVVEDFCDGVVTELRLHNHTDMDGEKSYIVCTHPLGVYHSQHEVGQE